MRVTICYESPNGDKLYYSKNGGLLTTNVQQASVYPSIEDAEKNLKKVNPNSFPAEYKHIVPQLKLVDIDPKTDYFQGVAKQYLNMDVEEFKIQLQKYLDFIGALPYLHEQIRDGIAKSDAAEIQDFMHIIEFGEMDVEDSINIVQAIRQSRQVRRQHKIKQALLLSLARNTTEAGTLINQKVIGDVNRAIKNQEKDKKWTFKTSSLEQHFSYLLERTGNYNQEHS